MNSTSRWCWPPANSPVGPSGGGRYAAGVFERTARIGVAVMLAVGLLIAAPITTVATAGADSADSGFRLDEVGRLSAPGAASAGRLGNAMRITDPPPLPPPPPWVMPPHGETGRRAVYSKTNQWVWTVEADGTISSAQPVSGRRTWNQPNPGVYQVFSRSPQTCNITNRHICMRWMVRFTVGPSGDNIGFHEIPMNHQTGRFLQTEAQLGQARSDGCVRMSTASAQFMWNWAPVGTTVVVLP